MNGKRLSWGRLASLPNESRLECWPRSESTTVPSGRSSSLRSGWMKMVRLESTGIIEGAVTVVDTVTDEAVRDHGD